MTSASIKLIIQSIRKNPTNSELWEELIQQATKEKKDKIALWAAYSVKLLQSKKDYSEIYQNFIQNREDTSNFSIEVFKLPRNVVIILLFGIMNMDIDELETQISSLVKEKYRYFIFDMKNLHILSGLGPSFFKRAIEYISAYKSKVYLGSCSQEVEFIIKLKKIDLQRHNDTWNLLENLFKN